MTIYEPTEVEVGDIPAGVHDLGVDGEGAQHYLITPTDPVIYVVEDEYDYVNGEFDTTVERFDLDQHSTGDWVDHVGAQRGWQVLHFERVSNPNGSRQEVGA